MTDFFISYTAADRAWAEWIASVLEEAGYTTKIQAWDFRPGGNFIVEMQRATVGSNRTIAVLSPDYLRSLFAMAEWAAAFAADPDGTKGKLVPVLVRKVPPETLGLMATIIHINLVDLGEAATREALLKGLVPGRVRPESVRFPGAHLFPGLASPPPDLESAQDLLADLPLEGVPLPGPLPVGSRMPLAANPLFVGREEDLKTLARQLRSKGTSAVGQIAAASGLGGIGKTQLASEFVHRYGRFFAGGVFWLSFGDAGAVPLEVAACGSSLGLHSSFDTLTLEQQVRLVEEAWKSPLTRLLVFDNCEEEGLLRRWRPPFGGARVLVTSRRSNWDPALGVNIIPLTTLARPASIELLRRFRPDLPKSAPALNGVAAELGDLPLALHLAGSFLRAYRNSADGEPAAYLSSLRQTNLLTHPSLEGRGSNALPTGHGAHVGRTFALSFERLDPTSKRDALAAALLARAAWFAPGDPIPRSLLLTTVQANSENLTVRLDAEDALSLLTDLGYLEASREEDLVIHRLVALWARTLTGAAEAQTAVESAVLAEAARLNEARNLTTQFEPHLRTVTEKAIERDDLMTARLCDELGLHLWHAGDYQEARRYLERAVSLHEQISGMDHTDTANSLDNLGIVLEKQGLFEEARVSYERALAIRKRELGLENVDTAHSLNNLGSLLQEQGDYPAAYQHFEQARKILEKVLFPEHRDVATSLNNLGHLLQIQGKYAEAQEAYEQARKIWTKTLGLEHPDTATALNNLGSLLQTQGKPAEARSYYEQALAIREKVLGPDHPLTAASLNNLGFVLQVQRDFERARAYYDRALTIRQEVLGAEHPDTAQSLNNLGFLLQEEGDLTAARPYYERALAIREKVLGAEHPDTARILNNLGALLDREGDSVGARDYYERALKAREKVFGDHPDTAQSLNNFGYLLREQGDLDGARNCYKRALAILEAHFGPDHESTRAVRRNLEKLGLGPSTG